ncbi:hypothetical protein [Cryptosporangium phraense]|uniref:Uncharacterized protein n=1 Tax=Cryptosporangium phraense TaxID=2593070 RepID=A0A545AM59_9ACTN|nr:hypothetical protein [Cryptosporangium phraense]TQS42361.1 hypothetical protein FL583_23890 [Cryptosporangium phraense]
MPQRPPDDLDRLLAEHAGPGVDALDTPEITAALDALGDRIVAGEATSPRRPRRRGTVVAASAALAVALAVGAPAAADFIGLHTGEFGLPGKTENDTSEFLRADSPEFPALVEKLGRDYPLPPGGDYSHVLWLNEKAIADHGPYEFQERTLRWDVANDASCQWQKYWLDGYDRHDAAQQAAARKVLDEIPDWEGLKQASDNGTDWEQRAAKAVRIGDVAGFRYLHGIMCGAATGPTPSPEPSVFAPGYLTDADRQGR